jgi:hypothetical protein
MGSQKITRSLWAQITKRLNIFQTLCQFHCITQLLDDKMKPLLNTVGFTGCLPNPPCSKGGEWGELPVVLLGEVSRMAQMQAMQMVQATQYWWPEEGHIWKERPKQGYTIAKHKIGKEKNILMGRSVFSLLFANIAITVSWVNAGMMADHCS